MKAPVDRSCVINKVVRLRKGKRARCGYVRDIYSIIFFAGTSTASRRKPQLGVKRETFRRFFNQTFSSSCTSLKQFKMFIRWINFSPPILCAGKKLNKNTDSLPGTSEIF